MHNFFKILKPFIPSIILAIALLYCQGMADLALPDYMSQIVNYGIQQNGFENSIPSTIDEKDYDNITSFLDEDGKNEAALAYEISSDGEKYVLRKDFIFEDSTFELSMAKALISYVEGEEHLKLYDLADSKTIIKAGTNALKKYYESIGINTESLQRNYILKIGGIMIIVTIIGAIATILVGLIASKTASGVGKSLREKIFMKIQSFSSEEFDKFSTASLITRSTNDVIQIQNVLVMMIRIIFYAPIIGIGGVIKALEKSHSMSWIIALAVFILILTIFIVFKIALPKFKLIQKLLDKLNMVLRENLTGMMVIRAFNTQEFEEDKFDDVNKELTDVNLFVNKVMIFLHPAMMLIMNGTSLLIVWIGAHQIAASAMEVGDMMAFMQYALQIIFAFLMLSMMFIMVPRAIISAQRINEILETESSIKEPKDPVSINSEPKGKIVYNNVSFKFPGAEEYLLKNIDFSLEPGKITSIIGSTGSGKTTVAKLLLRFFDVTDGEILMDGINIKDMSTYDLRELIGYIPQKPSLFSGTIESNLKYSGTTISDEELNNYIEISQVTNIINEKDNGIKSVVSQGGGNLSGGQKQRLSIGRALAKNPKIFVIDDSFSALDFKTDSKIRKALADKLGSKTVLLIAQRISTIKNSDKIIVLDEGNVCGIGKHNELMESCPIYKEIALSQLSTEELA